MMSTKKAFVIWLAIGSAIPYAFNVVSGNPFYGFRGFFFIEGFNLVAALTAFASFCWLPRRFRKLNLLPTVVGALLLSWGHFRLSLSGDAQAGVALVFIPVATAVIMALLSFLLLFVELFWGIFHPAPPDKWP